MHVIIESLESERFDTQNNQQNIENEKATVLQLYVHFGYIINIYFSTIHVATAMWI